MTRNSSKKADLAIAEKDWPTLLRDNSRSGGQSPQIFKAPVGARWQLKVEGSVRSAPVLRGGLLYVTSVSGFLQAIDVVTGRLKWRFKAPASIHSTPSLSGGRVLFGCGDGSLLAGRPAADHNQVVSHVVTLRLTMRLEHFRRHEPPTSRRISGNK